MTTRAEGIGKVLREARKSRGLTQAEIAPTLGVSRSSVAQMENGKRAVRAEDVERLALRYGCSTGELLSSEHHDRTPPEDGMKKARARVLRSPELRVFLKLGCSIGVSVSPRSTGVLLISI